MLDPAIPPALLMATPRTIRRRRKRGWVARLCLFLIIAIPLILTAAFIAEAILLARAPLLRGTITGYDPTQSSRGGSSLRVRYRFVDPAGRTVDATEQIHGTYKTLGVGNRLAVRWIQLFGLSWSEPDLIYKQLPTERQGFWVQALVLDLVVLGFFWRFQRQQWLLRQGMPVIGRIIGRARLAGRSKSFSINAAYIPAGVELYCQASGSSAFFQAVREDDFVYVLCDRDRPMRSLIYEASTYECAAPRNAVS